MAASFYQYRMSRLDIGVLYPEISPQML